MSGFFPFVSELQNDDDLEVEKLLEVDHVFLRRSVLIAPLLKLQEVNGAPTW